MTTELTFNIAWEESPPGDPLEAATYGSLSILLGDLALTEIEDRVAQTTRGTARVSAYPLAMWLASEWWRLRWEGPRKGPDWRLSHQLTAAGSGYVWPLVTFSSDGELVRVQAHRYRAASWEPIIYLNSAEDTVPAGEFERSVGDFIETVSARLAATGYETSPLQLLWNEVQSERGNPEIAQLRRLEALLGYDPDGSPSGLLDDYLDGSMRFGSDAIAELAAAAANRAAAPDWIALEQALAHGDTVRIPDFPALQTRALLAGQGVSLPWQRGEEAARVVRDAIGMPTGPLGDDMLRDWLGTTISDGEPWPGTVAFASRQQAEADTLKVRYRSGSRNSRRFELARLFGDHLVASRPDDLLLCATRGKTARQSEQRAFAAELLVPWDDLIDAVGDDPDEEAMESVARQYEVSPLVVRTRLVNKGQLPRNALPLSVL